MWGGGAQKVSSNSKGYINDAQINSKSNVWVKEMAGEVKVLHIRTQVQSPNIHVNSQTWRHVLVTPVQAGRDGQTQAACWPDSLVETASFRLKKKKKGGKGWKETFQCQLLASTHASMDEHIRAHAPAYMQTTHREMSFSTIQAVSRSACPRHCV